MVNAPHSAINPPMIQSAMEGGWVAGAVRVKPGVVRIPPDHARHDDEGAGQKPNLRGGAGQGGHRMLGEDQGAGM